MNKRGVTKMAVFPYVFYIPPRHSGTAIDLQVTNIRLKKRRRQKQFDKGKSTHDLHMSTLYNDRKLAYTPLQERHVSVLAAEHSRHEPGPMHVLHLVTYDAV
jgi:hypothetical protein